MMVTSHGMDFSCLLKLKRSHPKSYFEGHFEHRLFVASVINFFLFKLAMFMFFLTYFSLLVI